MIDVEKLIIRGDKLSLEKGRLKVIPASGKSVPNDWLKRYERQITIDVLRQLNMDALVYLRFDKGVFQGKYQGIHLQFESLLACTLHYCLFNAEVKYSRGIKVGQLLPGKQFRAGDRSDFLKFWRRTGLKIPERRGSFHDYMGNLKPFVFTARYGMGEQLEKKTLAPLSVSCEQITAAYLDKKPRNNHTATIQTPNNNHTALPYKESTQDHRFQGLETNESAGNLNHGIRLIGNAVIRENVIPILPIKKPPQEQTVDEWLADYDGYKALNFPNDFG